MGHNIILSGIVILFAVSAIPVFGQNLLTEEDIQTPVQDIYTPTVEALYEFGSGISEDGIVISHPDIRCNEDLIPAVHGWDGSVVKIEIEWTK